MIRRAAEAINRAERPIIISGHGIIWGNASSELIELAEKAQIPVITTFLGIGGFPETNPLSYGFLGMHGMYHANMAADEADVVVGIGMRFDDRAMGRFNDFNPDGDDRAHRYRPGRDREEPADGNPGRGGREAGSPGADGAP